MRSYNFFNRRRVTVQDMNNMQDWMFTNLRNYVGTHLEKGIVREIPKKVLGSTEYGFVKDPQQVYFDQSSYLSTTDQGDYFDIPVVSSGITAMYFIDAGGRLFYVSSNDTYKDSPTEFENQGNIKIPLASGNGDYYIWIEYVKLRDINFRGISKDGTVEKPKTREGYRLRIIHNSSAQPPANVIYLGRINKDDDTLKFYDDVSNPTVTPKRLYAGIKQESVNIEVDSSEKPETYTDTTETTLKDHINAIGDGTIRPENPHASKAFDVEALSQEDVSTKSRKLLNGFANTLESSHNINNYAPWLSYSNTGTSSGNPAFRLVRSAPASIIIDGKTFLFSNAQPFPGSGNYVELDFVSGDLEGWYEIYAEQETAFDDFFTIKKERIGDGFATNIKTSSGGITANRAVLGYVFWVNSGGTEELRANERIAGGASGSILSLPDIGGYDPDTEVLKRNSNFKQINRNLIPDGNFTYYPEIKDNGRFNGVWDRSGLGLGATQGFSTSPTTGSVLTGTYVQQLGGLINGDELRIIIPNKDLRPWFNTDGSGKLFTFVCTIRMQTTDDATATNYLEIDSTPSTLSPIRPALVNDEWQDVFIQVYHTGGAGDITINFKFLGDWGTNNFYIDRVELRPGKDTSADISPTTSIDNVAYDTKFLDNEHRTEIINQRMDNIVKTRIPMATKISGGVDEAGSSTRATWKAGTGVYDGTDTSNLEMWCVQAKTYKDSGTGRYQAKFTFDNTKYQVVSVSHSGPGDEWIVNSGTVIYAGWSLFVSDSSVFARCNQYGDLHSRSGDIIFFTAIMKRIAK